MALTVVCKDHGRVCQAGDDGVFLCHETGNGMACDSTVFTIRREYEGGRDIAWAELTAKRLGMRPADVMAELLAARLRRAEPEAC